VATTTVTNGETAKGGRQRCRLRCPVTERERQVVNRGISNFEFHYLGSAKILGGVGKGLAEAMADLKHPKN
jgi:hypothetical protein